MSAHRKPADVHTRRGLLRRGSAALAGVGVSGLAGCSGENANPFADAEWRVFLDDFTQLPADAGVEVSIEKQGDRITPEETVGFRLTTTNRDSDKRLSVGSGPQCCLFDRERGGSRPAALWLYHVDSLPTKAEPDRWTANRSTEEERTFDDEVCPLQPYDAGESVTNEYQLWSDYRILGYLPPGAYRFRTTFRVAERESESPQAYDWEFNVTIDRVGAEE